MVASGPAADSVAGAAPTVPVVVPATGGPSALRRLLGYLSLAVKLALFGLVFALAVKNSEPVTLRFFLGREVETSLALALVAALCAGALFGVLAMAGHAFGLRREGSRARADRDLLRAEHEALQAERDWLRSELAALAPSASAAQEGALQASANAATDRQVPHGL